MEGGDAAVGDDGDEDEMAGTRVLLVRRGADNGAGNGVVGDGVDGLTTATLHVFFACCLC